MCITFIIDDKRYYCNTEDYFLIEIGFKKSSYKSEYRFNVNDVGKAILYYTGINTHSGFKKRLTLHNKTDKTKQIITKFIS